MDHLGIFLIVSTLLLMFVTFIWSRADLWNVLIKMVFALATIDGVILVIRHFQLLSA